MSTPLISVIVVNYNSWKYTNKLILSLHYISNLIHEVIVIDNDSTKPGKIDKNNYKTHLIINKTNIGFGRAVNQGISISKSKYILLLNPDTELIDSSISKLLEIINNDKTIGAVGGKIVDCNTRINMFSANSKPTFLTGIFEFTNLKKLFPNNPFTNSFWIEKGKNINSPILVHSLCGAFILFRNKNKKKLLFDPDFFLYLEDLQFGNDINKIGLKVIFEPNSVILHHGGKSNDSKYHSVLKYWYESRKIYFTKNLPILQSKILVTIFSIEEKILKIYHLLNRTPNE